jgi:hypothetical protein
VAKLLARLTAVRYVPGSCLGAAPSRDSLLSNSDLKGSGFNRSALEFISKGSLSPLKLSYM